MCSAGRSWSPREGARNFGWLDRVLDLLHHGGIRVCLATPTASPPPWLGHDYPETLPVDADGRTLWYGSRNQFSPSSARYRRAAAAITESLAERYAGHPAVAMWHVGNELGQISYDDESALAFRAWLMGRYGSDGGAEPRLGHHLLEPAVRQLGRDHAAAARALPDQPQPDPGLPALHL